MARRLGGVLAKINYALLFWVDGLTCIVASFLLFYFLAPEKSGEKKRNAPVKDKTNSAYRDLPFLKGMFYLFLIAVCFFQLFSIIPAYYKSELQLNEAVIGGILAMNGLLIAAFEMILVYKLDGRKDALTYLMAGAVLIALSFLILGGGKTIMVAVVSMIVVTFGEMFLFPFLNNFWVKRSNESNRGEYASLYMMSWAGATVLAPTLATQIAARAGFTTLWLADFGFCGLAAAGFYFLKRELS